MPILQAKDGRVENSGAQHSGNWTKTRAQLPYLSNLIIHKASSLLAFSALRSDTDELVHHGVPFKPGVKYEYQLDTCRGAKLQGCRMARAPTLRLHLEPRMKSAQPRAEVHLL